MSEFQQAVCRLGTGRRDISSATLHIIAMVSMLIDHATKTIIYTSSPITLLGRLAFPIFAFMAVEGFFHTRNLRKYMGRMLIFALISEIPFNLESAQKVFSIYYQNVMWTLLLALLSMALLEWLRSVPFFRNGRHKALWGVAAAVVAFLGFLAGDMLQSDYGGMGVLMALVFYFFRGRTWKCMLGQFLGMVLINVVFLGAFGDVLQSFALLALIPIWLYRGRQGHHSKGFQYFCYAFYPVHMLVLVGLEYLMM